MSVQARSGVTLGDPCPTCGQPLTERADAFVFKERRFKGLVCEACKGLWDHPGDSFLAAALGADDSLRLAPRRKTYVETVTEERQDRGLIKEGAISFVVGGGQEVVRFEPGGACYVRGTKVDDDREVYKVLKAWMKNVEEQWAQARVGYYERQACPCLHTTPCDPRCSCVDSLSSSGCLRCCCYGSPEQQKAAAERLAALIDKQEEGR